MADDIDFASDLAAAASACAVGDVQRALAGAGQADCVECGREIAPARRAAAPFAVRCVGCQNLKEGNRL